MDPTGRSAEKKTRSACNRCHTQKLRCVRSPGELQCERCRRLDTPCRFSPRAPRGSIKPQVQSATMPSLDQQHAESRCGTGAPMLQATGGDDSIDLSVAWPVRGDIWPDLIAPNGIDLINQDATLQGMVDETQPWTAESSLWGLARQSLGMEAVPIPESPPSMTITHELANLSIALSELARQLPSTEEHETCARDESSCDTRREMPFVFDDLFRLTTKFIDLVKRLLRGRGLRDEATALMVGSCHSRLAEMYTIIFSLMRCCIQRSLAPPRPNWAMVLPSVQLGSLTSPAVQVDGKTQLPSEKVSLYIRMIAVFSSQLWAQLIDAVRGQHQTPLVDSGMTPLVHTLWTEMGDRMDILLRTINSTKSLLR